MNLPWDQEAGKALRAAQAVLAPADVAWFEAAHAPAFFDPAAAMEHIFGQLLGGDAGPAANADLEPEAVAPMRRHEHRVGGHAPTEPAARPAPSSRARAPRRARSACASADFRQAAPAGRARWPFSRPRPRCWWDRRLRRRPTAHEAGRHARRVARADGASRRLGPGRARGAAAGLVLRCRRSSRIKRNSSCRRGN